MSKWKFIRCNNGINQLTMGPLFAIMCCKMYLSAAMSFFIRKRFVLQLMHKTFPDEKGHGCRQVHFLFHQETFCVAVDAQIFIVLVVLVFVAEFSMDFVNKQLVNDATTKGIENHILTLVVLYMVVFVVQLAGNR